MSGWVGSAGSQEEAQSICPLKVQNQRTARRQALGGAGAAEATGGHAGRQCNALRDLPKPFVCLFPGGGGGFCGPQNPAKFLKICNFCFFGNLKGLFPYDSMVSGDQTCKQSAKTDLVQ